MTTTPPLLTDEQIAKTWRKESEPERSTAHMVLAFTRAIESATRAPLLAEIERLTAELAEAHAGRERIGAILEDVARALKGDPEPLALHSWHDLADVARRLTAERDAAMVDAERWRYAMDWNTTKFAVCKRVGDTGTCWEPIKTSGPLDAAIDTARETTNG